MTDFIAKIIEANEQKEGTSIVSVNGQDHLTYDGTVIPSGDPRSYTEANRVFW